jgi:hypothetical protein
MTGFYTVTVDGPTHVTHKSVRVSVQGPGSFAFYVLPWGYSRFGAVYDDTFHRFFHQLARVRSSGTIALGKWSSPPRELYVVEGSVPDEQFAPLLSVLSELNDETVPVLWCGTAGPLKLVTGPDLSFVPNGTIIVRPNWDGPATGTTAVGNTQHGIITMPVSRPRDGRLGSPTELKGALAHELFHVAGGFHVCGGGLGANPFGFSPVNCPYPDSLMANLGDLPTKPSPQDRLAACLIYSPATQIGNTFPDTNPFYAPNR